MICFNPHPTRRSGATPRSHRHALRVCRFNPHPTRRSGATRVNALGWPIEVFQSSPDPEVGCNVVPDFSAIHLVRFQSSPDPEVGCNAMSSIIIAAIMGFNPHPTRRSGATPKR